MDGFSQVAGECALGHPVVPEGDIGDRQVEPALREVDSFVPLGKDPAFGVQELKDRGGQRVEFDFGPVCQTAQCGRHDGLEMPHARGGIEDTERAVAQTQMGQGGPQRADHRQGGVVGVERRGARGALLIVCQQLIQFLRAVQLTEYGRVAPAHIAGEEGLFVRRSRAPAGGKLLGQTDGGQVILELPGGRAEIERVGILKIEVHADIPP